MKPKVVITAGDPNGVGYEIILKGIADPHILEVCTPIVYGNPAVAGLHSERLDDEYKNINWEIVADASAAKEGKYNMVVCYQDNTPVNIGVNTKEGGAASLKSLQRATQDLKAHKADILLTAPINKENIQADNFKFSGHTEFLTQHFGSEEGSLMMMVSEVMRVALVTNHLPLSQVSSAITEERILNKLHILNRTLQNDFSIRQPRIAVLALNPHAGDNGLIGTEEQTTIAPAIEKAKEDGLCVFGPYSADGFFGAGKYTHFDAVLAMYHDQGLIPFKTLDMNGVNFTAGLCIVRTSPDHGTAYDLAGKNTANPQSFRHSLYLALDIHKTRTENMEINSNPLKVEPRENHPAPAVQ